MFHSLCSVCVCACACVNVGRAVHAPVILTAIFTGLPCSQSQTVHHPRPPACSLSFMIQLCGRSLYPVSPLVHSPANFLISSHICHIHMSISRVYAFCFPAQTAGCFLSGWSLLIGVVVAVRGYDSPLLPLSPLSFFVCCLC